MQIHITSPIVGLKKLTSDLERMEAGGIFASALVASPILSSWRHGFRSCREGIVEGHPSVPDSHFISTSEVWAYFPDEDEHLIRTLNRWYRLSRRSSSGHAPVDDPVSFGGRRG
ncbi:hypothetical protein [Oryzifoliimicrobium ureilyticus]|uniref:hypothetical protein n=1 Tax=Oryzifoliimicrobium ureilyticus TaxID=3113724 RepID=UPI0030766C17